MLRMRTQKESDRQFLLDILQRESHSHPLYCQSDTPEDAVVHLLNDRDKGALIFEDDSSGKQVGVVIFRYRNLAEQYDNEVFNQLDADLFTPNGAFVEVVLLWIQPDYRQLGLGSDLLRNLERQAKRRNIHLLYMQTEGTNIPGKRFLRKLKFNEVRQGPIWDDTVRVSVIKKI